LTRSPRASVTITGQAILLLGTLGVIWGVIAIDLRQDHQRALRDAEIQTANLAGAFGETVSGSIALLDQALEHVRDVYLRDPAHFTLQNWFHDKTVLREISVQLAVVDASGLTLTTTTANAPANVSVADREHFKVQVNAAEDRLFVSRPVVGRASGKLAIQFTRRMTWPDGRFAGIVVASLDPHVLGVFRESERADRGFAVLIGRDGIIRAARPDVGLIGGDVAAVPDLRLAPVFDDGQGDGTATEAGPNAIVSYRDVPGYPLFVAVGVSRRAAFASYDQARRDSLLAGLCLSLIVLLVGFMTLRQWLRLTRFHRALTVTLNNISQGIMMVDARRRMPVVNRRVAELLGLPPEIARSGGGFDDFLRWQQEHDEFRHDPRVAAMIAAGGIDPALAHYERTRADGTVLEVHTSVLPDGGAVRTFTDVTERKRIEREMAQARDAAEAGIRARTEFLAVMGHEIRTPINGIVGAAGLLAEMRLNAEQQDYVRVIRDSSEHLSSLIQNVLDFSLLDAGRLELDDVAFDPAALIGGTIAMLLDQARAKGLILVAETAPDLPARISGDPARLRQILVNLIGNGIKFTETGGVTVTARMHAAEPGTAMLEVSVGDTGIGIDPDNAGRLFSAFTQVDGSKSRRFDGSGLGLAICRHLVTLMGGTIEVESTPGRGSVFGFSARLKLLPAEPARAATPVPAPSTSRPLRVLLAEDNPTNRHVATRMLTRMGHRVDQVEDGARAVVAASIADYDVILMDVMMPDVDGLAATRMIRAGTPPRSRAWIVGLTANSQASDREACEAAGMDDFVTKPVTMERLRAVLEHNGPRAAGTGHPVGHPVEAPADVTEVLDTGFLASLAGDIGGEGVVEMLRIFLEDAPSHMMAIRHAMTSGAIQTVRREAHALAGAASTVGLTRLGRLAAALQKASEGTGPAAEVVEMLAEALRESLPLAAAWADAHDVTTAPSNA